jgi:hypothetical protein
MDKSIIAKLASCMDTIMGYRIDFDEIDGKIKLIYELLSVFEGPANTVGISYTQ